MNLTSRLGGNWWSILTSECGRWVTSWKVWLFFLPFFYLHLVGRSFNGDVRASASSALIGLAFNSVSILVCHLVVSRRGAAAPAPSWQVCMVVWFLTGLTTYLVTAFAYARLVGHDPEHLADSVGLEVRLGLLYAFNRLIAAGVMIYLDFGRRKSAGLQVTNRRLAEVLSGLDGYIADVQTRCVEFIRDSVRPRIDRIKSDVGRLRTADQSGAEVERLVSNLEHLAVTDVRELSHTLGAPVASSDGALHHVPSRVALDTTSATDFSLRRFIPPVTTTALVMLAPLLIALTSRRLGGVYPVFVITPMWPVLCVAVGGAFMRFVARNRSPGAELITAATALAIPVGTGAIGLWAFAGQEVPILHLRSIEDALELLWWGFAFLSVCSAGLAWVVSFSAHRVHALDAQLIVANEQLTQVIAARELECDRIRRTLAHLVHGPVQGRLALAAVMLRQWSTSSPNDMLDDSSPIDSPGVGRQSMEQVEELLALVEDDLEQLPHMVASRSLREFLPKKANELRGFVDLRWHVADDVFELLGAHPGLERRVTLVVEEAIANAFRHGLAERVDVLIALKSVEAVELSICVTDDGLGVSGSDSSGLGMSMFGALTSSWELGRDSHGRTSFTALVAERPVDLSQLAGV